MEDFRVFIRRINFYPRGFICFALKSREHLFANPASLQSHGVDRQAFVRPGRGYPSAGAVMTENCGVGISIYKSQNFLA